MGKYPLFHIIQYQLIKHIFPLKVLVMFQLKLTNYISNQLLLVTIFSIQFNAVHKS